MALAEPIVDELGDVLRTLNQRGTDRRQRRVGPSRRALADLDGTLVRGAPDRDHPESRSARAGQRARPGADDHPPRSGGAVDGRKVAERLEAILDPEKDPRLDNFLTDDRPPSPASLRENLGRRSPKISGTCCKAPTASSARPRPSSPKPVAGCTGPCGKERWRCERSAPTPPCLLFGDDETDLEARDLDLTEIRLRGRARPYEQRDERDEP